MSQSKVEEIIFDLKNEHYQKTLLRFLQHRASLRHLDLKVYNDHDEYETFHRDYLQLMAQINGTFSVLEIGHGTGGIRAAAEFAQAKKLEAHVKNWSFVEKQPMVFDFEALEDDFVKKIRLKQVQIAKNWLVDKGAQFYENGLEALLSRGMTFDFVVMVHGFIREVSWIDGYVISHLLNPGGRFLTIGYRGAHTHAEHVDIKYKDLEVSCAGSRLIVKRAKKNS